MMESMAEKEEVKTVWSQQELVQFHTSQYWWTQIPPDWHIGTAKDIAAAAVDSDTSKLPTLLNATTILADNKEFQNFRNQISEKNYIKITPISYQGNDCPASTPPVVQKLEKMIREQTISVANVTRFMQGVVQCLPDEESIRQNNYRSMINYARISHTLFDQGASIHVFQFLHLLLDKPVGLSANLHLIEENYPDIIYMDNSVTNALDASVAIFQILHVLYGLETAQMKHGMFDFQKVRLFPLVFPATEKTHWTFIYNTDTDQYAVPVKLHSSDNVDDSRTYSDIWIPRIDGFCYDTEPSKESDMVNFMKTFEKSNIYKVLKKANSPLTDLINEGKDFTATKALKKYFEHFRRNTSGVTILDAVLSNSKNWLASVTSGLQNLFSMSSNTGNRRCLHRQRPITGAKSRDCVKLYGPLYSTVGGTKDCQSCEIGPYVLPIQGPTVPLPNPLTEEESFFSVFPSSVERLIRQYEISIIEKNFIKTYPVWPKIWRMLFPYGYDEPSEVDEEETEYPQILQQEFFQMDINGRKSLLHLPTLMLWMKLGLHGANESEYLRTLRIKVEEHKKEIEVAYQHLQKSAQLTNAPLLAPV